MDTFLDILAETRAAHQESRTLALKLWEHKQAGITSPGLSEELNRAQIRWDECSAQAVLLATDRHAFRLARQIAPEDGRAHRVIPYYLLQLQS